MSSSEKKTAQHPASNIICLYEIIASNSIQIMYGYECNGTDIFGFASLNRTFHLSPNENRCTIARIKSIHYLFYITSI